jgi:hypothetical protein
LSLVFHKRIFLRDVRICPTGRHYTGMAGGSTRKINKNNYQGGGAQMIKDE